MTRPGLLIPNPQSLIPMLIGLTYDLRNDYLAEGYSEEETAEFDRPDTIEAIEAALVELGYQTERIGRAKRLVERLAAGDRWNLVFNIAEGFHGGPARERRCPRSSMSTTSPIRSPTRWSFRSPCTKG